MNFSKIEAKILKFWKENKIFEKSIEQRKKAKDFVFYEGPPTANAEPGIHNVLARVFKDLICRYKTMRGFRVLRKAGWDTHGLPVELEIEKKLELRSKREIEKYGISEFCKKCKESVWQYKEDWERLTERIGFWLDMENPYITYDNNYIETLWWITKQIWQKGLLYKDYKVVPYCPRCGTSLSSHEVALGYERIKESALYVKFKIQNSKFKDTYLLVWTTTPWTLPGNVAVAVHPDFSYVKLRLDEENFILAKERIEPLNIKGEILEEFKGRELLGLNYQPLFPQENLGKRAYSVIPASFVSLKEGTGLVHIAPAFGEEDMFAGKENNLPIILNVDEEGKFKEEVKNWASLFVKEADPLIIEDLKKRNLLFKKEMYEHDYPFCWRCDSPLLYYAKESWWIKMTASKENLIKNNQKINWIPDHLKEGRFGEWLKEIKDWALSRERYWGTPLPIWKCQNCGNLEVIGSKEDLVSQKYSKNQYLILRHGETAYQKEKILYDWPAISSFPLTENGKKKIKKLAEKLKKEKLDLIYSSDALRARQTAEIMAKELKLQINFDPRLRDINLGVYKWRKKDEFLKDFPVSLERFKQKIPKGENWPDVKKRVIDFIKDVDGKHNGKRILIVSHGDPLWLLEGVVKGLENGELLEERKKNFIKIGQIREFDFKNLPFNEGELDFHRPFIDEVKFYCKKCQGIMERQKEVIDCWFDSGAMPFAQNHWPFDQKEKDKPPKLFPADYISEGVDQTRGWFYTLLAISTLLGFGESYKNVISLGLVLDEKGEKMSKSKGNVVDPWQIIEKCGTDSLRWYFFTVNQPGEDKLFTEKGVNESLKKFLMTFWNCFLFFKTYGIWSKKSLALEKSKNILDKWIISKLNNLVNQVTEGLDNYEITLTSRIIEKFLIEDLSQWYIRRSRRRFQKPEKEEELSEASATLKFILLTLTKLTAPFLPFLSEEIYKEITNSKSIHLEDWPKVNQKFIDKEIEEQMDLTRKICSLGLKARAKAKIKVRQPLPELQILDQKLGKEFLDLIREELNIEEVKIVKKLTEDQNWIIEDEEKLKIALNTEITQKLREEGIIREFIRQVQEMRKREGFTPKDKISIYFSATPELANILLKNCKVILKETKAKELQVLKELKFALEIKIDQEKIWLRINPVVKKSHS